MSWTYGADPAGSDLDAVRLEIGDTDTADQQMQDEELQYFLTRDGSVASASVSAVRALMARYARLVDKSVGDLSISYSQRLAAYEALLARLTTRRASGNVGLVVTGISRSRKETVDGNTDSVSPSFKRDDLSQFRSDESDILS